MGDLPIRGEIHASDEPSPVDGEARPVTNQGVAVEHQGVIILQKMHIQNQLPDEEDGKKETVQSLAQEPPQGF